MTPPTEQDLARIAAGIRLAGELLEAHGSRALKATDSWQRGPRSPRLDPSTSSGARTETVAFAEGEEVVVIPNDTTGEAALEPDLDEHTNRRLLRLIELADRTTLELRRILQRAAPHATGALTLKPDTPAQISAAGWCVSCHRVHGTCSPISMKPDGTRRYRDLCGFCGQMSADMAKLRPKPKGKKRNTATSAPLPPVELVEAHLRGQRITTKMFETAVRQQKDAKAS